MDTTPLKGKLALITGATGGIGRATARALAHQGLDLALHYHTDSTTAESLATSLRTTHPNLSFQIFQADLSTYDGTRALHAAVVERMGHPLILFANAGTTLGKTGLQKVEDVSIEEFEETWRTNAGTPFLLTQLCVPAMIEAGWGRVVFCSSVAGFTGGVVGPHYASSKSALHGLIHWLAQTYAKNGITVNGVAPALIEDTKMLPSHEDHGALAARIPMGRLGRPEEVAETVVWMCRTGYVTNKVVGVDGGMWVQ